MPPAETPARPSQPFTPQPWRDRQMELVLGNLLRWGVLLSAAIVFAGACVYLLLLIATPIARVSFSIVGFSIERDYLYVTFTVIVLLVLLYSFLGTGIGL